MSFDLGEISPNQQIFRLNNGRNLPKSEEIRPKFLRANLNCSVVNQRRIERDQLNLMSRIERDTSKDLRNDYEFSNKSQLKFRKTTTLQFQYFDEPSTKRIEIEIRKHLLEL
jgi:hypothetical protein